MQTWTRPLHRQDPRAPSAVLVLPPVRSVVAVAAVLGSENAEITGTRRSIILGLMASRSAKAS